MAQYADWIFVLARTNTQVKKQEGISFFLVDMKTPGITVRPIQTIDGGHEVNEVFFDDVRTSRRRISSVQENKGWDYAKFLLGNERTGIARIGRIESAPRSVTPLSPLFPSMASGPKMDDPFFRAKLAAVEVELKALEMTQMRVISNRRGDGKPDPASSVMKIKGSEIQQATTELLDGGRRALRGALRTARRPIQRASGRTRLGRSDRAGLFQQSQGFDLRRIERDSARHHRQGYSGTLIHGFRTELRTATRCATTSRDL